MSESSGEVAYDVCLCESDRHVESVLLKAFKSGVSEIKVAAAWIYEEMDRMYQSGYAFSESRLGIEIDGTQYYLVKQGPLYVIYTFVNFSNCFHFITAGQGDVSDELFYQAHEIFNRCTHE